MTQESPNDAPKLFEPKPDRGGKAQPMLIAKGLQRYFPIRGGILNRKMAEVPRVSRLVRGVVLSLREQPMSKRRSRLARGCRRSSGATSCRTRWHR